MIEKIDSVTHATTGWTSKPATRQTLYNSRSYVHTVEMRDKKKSEILKPTDTKTLLS